MKFPALLAPKPYTASWVVGRFNQSYCQRFFKPLKGYGGIDKVKCIGVRALIGLGYLLAMAIDLVFWSLRTVTVYPAYRAGYKKHGELLLGALSRPANSVAAFCGNKITYNYQADRLRQLPRQTYINDASNLPPMPFIPEQTPLNPQGTPLPAPGQDASKPSETQITAPVTMPVQDTSTPSLVLNIPPALNPEQFRRQQSISRMASEFMGSTNQREKRPESGRTPLFQTVTNCCFKDFESMIQNKADIQAKDQFGISPLVYLLCNHYIDSDDELHMNASYKDTSISFHPDYMKMVDAVLKAGASLPEDEIREFLSLINDYKNDTTTIDPRTNWQLYTAMCDHEFNSMFSLNAEKAEKKPMNPFIKLFSTVVSYGPNPAKNLNPVETHRPNERTFVELFSRNTRLGYEFITKTLPEQLEKVLAQNSQAKAA